MRITEPEDHLGMTDEQWAWFQAHTHGFGEQDENGIDVSLLRGNLRLTPAERMEKMLRVLPLFPGRGMQPIAQGLRTLFAGLDAHRLRYILTGGLAMTCHGSAYLTDDIDLACAYDPTNLVALAQALAPLRPRLRGPSAALQLAPEIEALRSNTDLALMTDVGDVHLLTEDPAGGTFETLRLRASRVDLFGISVRVAALDDLIAMKRVGGRPKDQLHLMELERLRCLLVENEPAKLKGG